VGAFFSGAVSAGDFCAGALSSGAVWLGAAGAGACAGAFVGPAGSCCRQANPAAGKLSHSAIANPKASRIIRVKRIVSQPGKVRKGSSGLQSGERKNGESYSASSVVFLRRPPCGDYCFFVGFLAPFFAAGALGAAAALLAAAAFLSASLPPISVKESAALNGYCRTEVVSVWPAAFKVTSTRRLLAHLITVMFRRN